MNRTPFGSVRSVSVRLTGRVEPNLPPTSVVALILRLNLWLLFDQFGDAP